MDGRHLPVETIDYFEIFCVLLLCDMFQHSSVHEIFNERVLKWWVDMIIGCSYTSTIFTETKVKGFGKREMGQNLYTDWGSDNGVKFQ